ncbi:MAG: DUF58 domain-containing protein [Pseudomonadaceae bacterium]|nr:DUF58 domain-containing protein [Pseudomonadaceae bacterium]
MAAPNAPTQRIDGAPLNGPRLPPGSRNERFGKWLDQRIPPAAKITLSQRNIFIFPTRTGLGFALLLSLLLLAAINYANALVYGVAFLLLSLFLVTILYTYRNLSGLTIEVASSGSGFVGEDVAFEVRLSRPKGRGREGIQLGWPGALKQWCELHEREADTVQLYVPAARRGLFNPGRLLIETFFPLGLLRAWTWVDLSASAIVYPKPIFGPLPDANHGHRDDGVLIDPRGSDDFTDIRAYQAGDPVRHILWRSYAREGELAVKQYASYVEPRLWLSLDDMDGPLESRLSRLTGHAISCHRAGREFGLRLGSSELSPDAGKDHLERVLKELALYGHG